MDSLIGIDSVVAEIVSVNKTETKISVFGGRNDDKELLYSIISRDTHGCMILPPFSEYRNVDIYVGDEDDENHVYRLTIKKLIFSSHGSIYQVDGNEMIEIGDIDSGYNPISTTNVCNIDNSVTMLSGSTCQRAFIFPCGKNRIDSSFELSGDGYVKRVGNHMGIINECCVPSTQLTLDPLAYNIRFGRNASNTEKLSSIMLTSFIDTTLFGNDTFTSETFN